MTNATNNRVRVWNPFFYHAWQASTDENLAADEIIEAPEKHLLNQSDLLNAEGGNMGLAVQMFGLLFGVGAVFASSKRMSSYVSVGSLIWQEKLCLGGAGFLGYSAGRFISIN